jgi:hypothetical protein
VSTHNLFTLAPMLKFFTKPRPQYVSDIRTGDQVAVWPQGALFAEEEYSAERFQQEHGDWTTVTVLDRDTAHAGYPLPDGYTRFTVPGRDKPMQYGNHERVMVRECVVVDPWDLPKEPTGA